MQKNQKKEPRLSDADRLFPDNDSAEQWFIQQRWPDGVFCPTCAGSKISSHTNTQGRQTFRCGDCQKDFTAKTKSPMADSKLGYQKWALTIYLMTQSTKSISHAKLASEVGITQKTAIRLTTKIYEAYYKDKKVAEKINAENKHKQTSKNQKSVKTPGSKQISIEI